MRKAISHHYDLPVEFWRLWLDPQLVYSCAYFEEANTTLADAQTAKLVLQEAVVEARVVRDEQASGEAIVQLCGKVGEARRGCDHLARDALWRVVLRSAVHHAMPDRDERTAADPFLQPIHQRIHRRRVVRRSQLSGKVF